MQRKPRTLLGDLFMDAPNVKRFETLFVLDTVKRGLDIPLRQKRWPIPKSRMSVSRS